MLTKSQVFEDLQWAGSNSTFSVLYSTHGCATGYTKATAWEIMQWLDTIAHYILAEVNSTQEFKADFSDLLSQIDHAK